MSRVITITHGSLTDGHEQLLVNASNTNVMLGSGVSGAIAAACGDGYQQHIHDRMMRAYGGPMEPGHVLITDAGSHPTARHVAHVAVMDYRDGFTARSYPTLELIESCCHHLWPAIESIQSESQVSIAMVALGTGTGNLGVRDSTEIACRTLKAHLEQNAASRIGDVTFYGYQLPEYVVTVEVVRAYFDVPDHTIPAEVKAYLNRSSSE